MTTPTSLPKALAAWTQLLGADRCFPGTDPRAQAYTLDVGEYGRRAIHAVLSPRSALEVQSLVRAANIYRVPLYSVSTGKNWGLGSRQPVEPGVIVDLGGMTEIRTIDTDERHVIVEPGVTQHALSEALASTAFIANLTASTPETSLVGNLLDKGIGLYRHRVDDLLGVEVVTGYGELLHVGGSWPMGRASFYFPTGLGPTLTPLFLQSNFGIVTACALKLIPRPQTLHILYATLVADRLGPALATLQQLRTEHALDAVVKLYNAHAFQFYSGRTASAADRTFHLVAALHGSDRWVSHVGPFVVSALHQSRCFDQVVRLDRDGLEDAPPLVRALARIFAGTPTEFAVERALGLGDGEARGEVDRLSPKGLIFIFPVVPLTGQAVLKTLEVLRDVSTRRQVAINTTINILSDTAVEMVSSILFQRRPADIDHAHAVKGDVLEKLARHGVALMRLDIDAQKNLDVFTDTSYREILVNLKRLFDPNGIIAPGRYIPDR